MENAILKTCCNRPECGRTILYGSDEHFCNTYCRVQYSGERKEEGEGEEGEEGRTECCIDK
jgi:hypothetical protein